MCAISCIDQSSRYYSDSNFCVKRYLNYIYPGLKLGCYLGQNRELKEKNE